MSFTLGNMWNKPRKNNTQISSKKNVFLQTMNIKQKQSKKIKKKVQNTQNIRGTKSFWGMPTWILFHTLAEKVDETKYKTHYIAVWNFIKDVCGGLPCPYCMTHASNYVSKIQSHQINTKEKLKNVLFTFHNSVNTRTNKPRETINGLEKYKSANLKKILELFMSRFFVSYIGTRQFNDWYKNKLKEKVNDFMKFYIKNLI